MNVLIVDDHALIREGVALMVTAFRPDAQICFADNCRHGLDAIDGETIDFVFLDLELPDEPGFSAITQIKQRQETIPVAVVSAHEDKDTVLRALSLGACAFISKAASPERMRTMIHDLLDGRITLPDNVLTAECSAVVPDDGHWNLTERQSEVLALLVRGLSNKMIARKLDIAESTVKIHVSAILREMKVASRTQALLAVARQGMRLPMHEDRIAGRDR